MGKAKQQYCFEVNDGELFAFAGIWDRWRDPSEQWIKSCSILTTTPNSVTSAVHDRMPVIVDFDVIALKADQHCAMFFAASVRTQDFSLLVVDERQDVVPTLRRTGRSVRVQFADTGVRWPRGCTIPLSF